jgi:hypothetical protein
MKLVSVLGAKVVRLFPVRAEEGRVVSAAALARAFEARYGFLQGPHTVQEYEMSNGVVFQRGMFGGKPVIDKFTIYNDGVVCDLSADSSIADSFIDDVIAWARDEQFLATQTSEVIRRAYLSNVDVQMDIDASTAFPGFDELCGRIAETIRSYGQHAPDFKPTMFGFHGDVTTLPGKTGPPGFSLERREGESYEANRYFSKAPLTTADHVELLGELERLLLSMTSV